MSVYKRARFGEKQQEQQVQVVQDVEWEQVDQALNEAILKYLRVFEQYKVLVIDNLIKLIIARTYINMRARKLLTAQKILESAKVFIKEKAEAIYQSHLESSLMFEKQVKEREGGRTIAGFDFNQTINELELRNRFEVPFVPLDILKQKYLAQKGSLFLAFKQPVEALECFTNCLKTGQYIDLRIRLEALIAIKQIQEQRGGTFDPM